MQRAKGTVAVFLLIGLLAACERPDRELDPDTVAAAGEFRLGVEDAAELLASDDDLPNQAQVVEALADFWADFVLLAWVANRENGLAELDLSPLVRQQTEQELVMRLRDQVIETEPTVTDDDVRAYFDEERPGDEVRARHILLLFPDDATEGQRDSVRALAADLRDRARAGADFAELAREHSEDPGSAAQGGDLGYFSRGTMVPPFEDAAFGLEPGEVSEVVETQFGLHLIRAEDRRSPAFEEVEDRLRDELRQARTMRAESIYVTELEERSGLRIEDDALERLREITEDPDPRLSGRAARRALVRFEGGAYTAADYREFLLAQDRGLRQQILNATDEQLEGLLMNVARSKVLVEEAKREGIEVASGELEELRRQLRREYRDHAEFLGLANLEPAEGESLRDAVDREVKELMVQLLSGERDLRPLGPLSLPLRLEYGTRVSAEAIERTVERVAALRNGAQPMPVDPGRPAPDLPEEMLPEEDPPGGSP